MKLRNIVIATALIAAWLTSAQPARADMVVYDSMSVFQGQQAFTDAFNISTPGTLTVSVNAVPWLDAVANLSFFLSSPSGVVGNSMSGSASEAITLQPGTYTASWFGNASQGPYDLGVIGVDIEFHPAGTPVPLPAAFLLMLSGLGMLFAWPRMIPGAGQGRLLPQAG